MSAYKMLLKKSCATFCIPLILYLLYVMIVRVDKSYVVDGVAGIEETTTIRSTRAPSQPVSLQPSINQQHIGQDVNDAKPMTGQLDPYLVQSLPKPLQSATRMCTHGERVKHLRSYCYEMFGDSLANTSPGVAQNAGKTLFSSTRIFTSDTKKVVWCEVSKAGCTTWNRDILGKFLSQSHPFKSQPLKTINETHADYIKLINIRHPFDRLWSGYSNVARKEGHARGPSASHIRYITAQFNTTKEDLTLSQFVQFLVSPADNHPRIVYHDRHWDPMSRSCKTCMILYDVISRIETIAEDAKPILKQVGLAEDLLIGKQPRHQNPNASSSEQEAPPIDVNIHTQTFVKVLPQFKELSPELLYKLYDKYRHDFLAFGYHFDPHTLTASCGIQLPSGEVCC